MARKEKRHRRIPVNIGYYRPFVSVEWYLRKNSNGVADQLVVPSSNINWHVVASSFSRRPNPVIIDLQ